MAESIWTLTIPAPTQWVSANDRSHWASKARLVKVWREAAAVHARAAKLPHITEPVHITGWVHRTETRRADAHNRILTVKAVIDGLVDAGVLTDDNDKHVTAVTMRAGTPVDRKTHPLGILAIEIEVENS
jgi:crossover junction endodeoxyribonuclease RusA